VKREWWTAVVAVVVVEFAYNFVLHDLILEPRFYAVLRGTLWRPADQALTYFPYTLAAYWSLAVAAVWMYGRSARPASPLSQGVRFGLALTGLLYLPWTLIWYATMPISSTLGLIWSGSALVEGQIVGQVVALLVTPLPAAT